jgi:aerobic-type carbon monoxide dehydrogenase small subunit (CoxS/CutS family)
MTIRVLVNGVEHVLEVRADETLLTVLRRDLGLLSVRDTCSIGACGACTVLLDGEPVSGCLLLAPLADGRSLETVEALADNDPVRRAFADTHAYQCGWCTPGMILTAKNLLAENPSPTEKEITTAMSGNLCRCGSYVKIVDAVRRAAS